MISFKTDEPNRPVDIRRGEFEIGRSINPITTGGLISIRWLPRPKLIFESGAVSFDHVANVRPDTGFVASLVPIDKLVVESGTPWRFRFNRKAEAPVDKPDFCVTIDLLRVEEGPHCHPDLVVFHVVNLVGLHEPGPDDFGWRDIKHTSFEGGGWQVELTHSGPDLDTLRESGGFALTHVGILKRQDKASFSTVEAANILSALYYFLSFTIGRWCWPCLYIGTSGSTFCWLRCTKPEEIDPAEHQDPSPPFTAREPVLRKCFTGFLKLWNRAEQQRLVQTALSWYVEANRARSPESAIVAGQTALELLAWFHLVQVRRTLSAHGFEHITAADKFRLLLDPLGVPVKIPTYVSELNAYSSEHNWVDAPQAISELRNSIVHPTKRTAFYKAPDAVREEVRWLTLWYLASVLARLFGYSGELRSY
jgi:hypothetical protein